MNTKIFHPLKATLFLIPILLLSVSCVTQKVTHELQDPNRFKLTQIATDPSYGHSPKNPIQVGGVATKEGPLNERRFLNALAGPNGEKVHYKRVGSCCPVKSKNDLLGYGQVPLDNYSVFWMGAQDTISIYINMYDKGPLKAPKGFTIKP